MLMKTDVPETINEIDQFTKIIEERLVSDLSFVVHLFFEADIMLMNNGIGIHIENNQSMH